MIDYNELKYYVRWIMVLGNQVVYLCLTAGTLTWIIPPIGTRSLEAWNC